MGALDKIILLLSGLVEIYMLYDFFDNSFEIRKIFLGRKKFYASLAAWLVLFGINLLENTYVNLFGLPIILFCYATILFDTKAGQRLLYVLIVEVAILCGEFLLIIFLEVPPWFLKISTIVNLSEISWQAFSAKLLSYLILTVVKQISGTGKHHMPQKIFLLYICQPIASVIIMMLSYYANMNVTVTENFKIMLTAGFVFLMLANILMFYAYNLYARQTAVTMQQEMTILKQNADLDYYMQVAEMNRRHRQFIHDTSHYLKVLGELAQEGKNENIINLVQEITGEIEQTRALVYCRNSVLNAVLQEKRQMGEEKGIYMDIYVEPEICTEGISDKDMVTMLGNLLDNAVRASSECEEKRYVKVRIFMQREGKFFVVKIENPYKGELLHGAEGLLSTKKEEGLHGIGLKSVENTAEKYGGYLQCDGEKQLFTATLVLKILKRTH
ncbi:MAG: GHKL domain-containing protein [Lachnospiraceae bacterium]|nr:GHKL domain-containing protein [Lachnospiraceae bacterium]